jgi:hypothetical protein
VTGEEVPDPSDRVVIYRYLNARAAEWPEADYVVGNPPFIGNKRMKTVLGDGYVFALRNTWKTVPESADFVMYWWNKSALLVQGKSLYRFGLITTNSLSQAFNKRIIESHLDQKSFISFAIPDHPWVDSTEGAQVRVAMTVFSQKLKPSEKGCLAEVTLEKDTEKDEAYVEFRRNIGEINPDLSIGANLSGLIKLHANQDLSCPGVQLSGQGFVLSEEDLTVFSEKTKSKIISKYLIGRDLTQTPKNKFVIDTFGFSELELRSHFPDAYQWLLERVKPTREQNTRRSYSEQWWLHAERAYSKVVGGINLRLMNEGKE